MVVRLFLARHGLAEYETELVTDDGGSLTVEGRAQARELGRRLEAEGIAAVWCSPLSRAVQTAEIAAGVLGVGVTVREGLREYGVGSLAGTSGSEREVIGPVFERWVDGDDEATIPGGEVVSESIERVVRVLTEVADRHEGESVLVVSHGGAVMATLPVLVGRPRTTAWHLLLGGGGYVELVRDGRAWSVTRETPDLG
ncbi:histidine phosphatase family protein [Nocardioides sp. W7]|uniref:histidine phosphatase family protein n=1 Tax=Nocardioides sp. W7 TaxID=2931390 RepID=UPI001FD3AF70|nr:histidine phosphatase family protein [Nocardioides sp. W7]